MESRKTIPLAPPIDGGSKRPFEWKSYWLSPKPKVQRRQRDENNYDGTSEEDEYDTSSSSRLRQQQRPRRASFDQTSSNDSNNNVRFNIERGGQRYFKRNTHDGAVYPSKRSNDSEEEGEMSFITMSRSVDDTIDETTEQLVGGDIERGRYHHHGNSSSSSQQPLLTAFLLHLNAILPEYCEHLSDTSNTLHSIGSASKAVDVLEHGAKTLSTTFGSVSATAAASKTPQSSPTSAPNSPSHLLDNTSSNKHHNSPKSDSDAASNSPSSDSKQHWLSPLSPRGSSGRIISMSPTKKKQMITTRQQQRQMRQQKLAESEWERFVAPFVNLVGAECFYAKMDHVLDPKRCYSTKEDLSSSEQKQQTNKKGKDSSSFVKFISPSSQKNETQSSSNEIQGDVDAPGDANKRGSRRLKSLYKQIRDELIIVGKLV